MWVSTAYAQSAGAGGGDMISALLPLVLIFAVFWFLVLRPQQKRMKEHKAMVEGVRRGDTVITGGGIYGKVTKVFDEEDACQVELSEDVRVKVVRSTIQTVTSRSDAGGDTKKEAPKSDTDSGAGEKKSMFSFGSKK